MVKTHVKWYNKGLEPKYYHFFNPISFTMKPNFETHITTHQW